MDHSVGNSLTSCLFCDKPYKRLRSHLQYCSMRKGRDYSICLSQKTLNNSSNKSTPFPTCGKKFARLDVHLRCSATCKQQFGEPTSPTQSELDQVPLSHVQLESISSQLQPVFSSICKQSFYLPSASPTLQNVELH